MFTNLINFFGSHYNTFGDYNYDNIDPQLIQYFKNEYGRDWKSALTEHVSKKDLNDKKAA